MKLPVFILLLFVGIVYSYDNSKVIASDKEKARKILIYDERIAEALVVFTRELNAAAKGKAPAETADNMHWVAECLFQLKEFERLEAALKDYLSYAKQHHPTSYAKLKITEGKYLIEKGKYKDCISALTRLSGQVTDKTILCDIELTLADACQRIQSLEKSRMHYQYVLKNAEDIVQTARAYNGLGSYYCLLSNLDSAAICYHIAYDQFSRYLGPGHSRTAQVLYNLGLVADRKVDFYTAEQYLTKALSIYKKRLGELHPRTAETFGTLGSLYLMEDNPEKALHYSVKERDILLQLYGKQHPDLAYSYLNCGKIHYLLNNYPESQQQLESAIDLVTTYFGKKHNLYSQCVVELSKIWTDQKKHREATQILSALIQLKQDDADDYLADVYLQAGENYLQQEEYKKAVHEFQKAHELYVRFYGERNIYSIGPLIGMSNVFLKEQNAEEAWRMAEAALSMTTDGQQIIYPYGNWSCMVQLLQCKKALYLKKGSSSANIPKDIALIQQTLEKANTIKNTLYTPGSQLYFTEKMSVLNRLGIYYLTRFYKKKDTYYYTQLLTFAENDKANLLRSKIINYKTAEILPEAERQKVSHITGRLNYFNSLVENKEKCSFNINDSMLFYQAAHEQFAKSVEKKYPKIHALKYGDKSMSVEQIREQLKKEYTFLEYFNDTEHYYCLAITQNSVDLINCGNMQYVDSLAAAYQSSILRKNYDKKTAQILGKLLLPADLQRHLIIAPDAGLSGIAFDALPQHNNKKADYLILHHTIQYAFSINTYFKNKAPGEHKNILAAFPDFSASAYPVLNSKKEKDALKEFSGYEELAGTQARKDRFIRKSANAGIIHISSHLIIDTVAPLQSALVFQPGKNHLLTINEIWKLSLHAQLVTLAACQGNFGKQQNGEGIRNFAWAFHYAGAHHILSTQWNASDRSTSVITGNFYTYLKAGKPKEEALRLAKTDYLKAADAIGIQPFYWANFYLYGDESPLEVSPQFLVKYWWVPVLLLILSYLAIITYHKSYRKKQYDNL